MNHQSYKTLVVDDDPNIRQLIRVNLEPRGFIVQEAPDGPTAMKAVEAHFPDLLLLELAQNLDAVLTHRGLLARVWGPEYFDASHYLHIYFGRIRNKIGPKYGNLLETVPGMGYSLRSSPP